MPNPPYTFSRPKANTFGSVGEGHSPEQTDATGRALDTRIHPEFTAEAAEAAENRSSCVVGSFTIFLTLIVTSLKMGFALR